MTLVTLVTLVTYFCLSVINLWAGDAYGNSFYSYYSYHSYATGHLWAGDSYGFLSFAAVELADPDARPAALAL